ncbi:tape measure protein [Rhodococcus ruber]
MPDLSGGSAFVEVMPSMRGYFKQVNREIQGKPIEHKIEPSVDKSALDKATRQLEDVSRKAEAARRKQADATDAVGVAESRLQTLVSKGVDDAGRLAAARAAVAKATRNQEAATADLQRIESAQRSAQGRMARIEARFESGQAEQEADGFFRRILSRADDTGPGIGSRLAHGIGRTLKGGLIAVGGAAAGALGTAITLGVGRLTAIDDARGKLRGLGHDAAAIDTIMKSALESVKGTAFGLGDAATIAASAVAAGIAPGKDLTRYLKLTADAAAIAGVALDEMGSIFNKVQTNGVAMTDDLQQLADRGIPIFTWLQKEYGVTGDALREMVTKGQVDAATFQKVIEQNIGGAALASGSTVSGAFDNAKAALGRFGAALIGPFFDQATGVLGAITTKLDEMTNRVGPWAQKVSDSVRFAFELLVNGNYDGALGTALGLEEDSPIVGQLLSFRDKVREFVDEYGARLGAVFAELRDAAIAAAPAVGDIVTSLGTAMGSAGLTTWELLVQTLEALAPAIEDVLIPALETVAGVMADNQGAVNTLIGGYLGFQVVGNVFDTAIGGLESVKGAVDEVTGVIDTGKELYQTYTDATYGIAQAQTTLSGKMAAAAGAIRGKAAAENISTIAATRAIVAEKLHAGALKIKAIALKAVTVAQRLWNAALAANPIGLIITAVAALVAGLVWFFTQTETGRKLWEKIWTAIQNAVKWAWENVIKPAWEGIQAGFAAIGRVLQWVWDNVLSPVFTAIKFAVGIVLAAFVLLGMVFSAIWDAIVAVAQWAWNTVLRPVFDAIMWVLGQVGAFFGWVWNTLIKPAWDALAAGIAWAWDNVIRPAWDALTAALRAIGDFFVWVWNALIKPTWDALGAGIAWVWNNVIAPAWAALKAGLDAVGAFFSWVWNSVVKPVWDALGAGIRWVVDNVILPVWDRLKGALDLVKDAFSTAVDWIGQVWDRIKAIAAKPVKFVVDTVYNKGIREAWNKVAGWLNLPKLDEAPLGELGNYARGTSRLPGYSPGHDNMRFVSTDGRAAINLGGGEGIARPEVVRAVGPSRWDNLNTAARTGGVPAVRRELGNFAGGGVVESIVDKVNRFFPGMSITSTYRDTNDLHGRGLAVDFSNGGTAGTPQMKAAARFFHDNYGPMLAELIHWPLAGWRNIDEGRPFDFGPATNDQHRDHVHVAAYTPLPEPGTPIAPIASGGGGGGGLFGWLRARVADAFEGVMNPIGNAIPDFGGGDIGKLPKLAFDKFTSTVGDFLRGKADKEEASAGIGAYGAGADFYASEIIRAAKDRALGKEGAAIGIATALVESALRMYANPAVPESLSFPHDALGYDHDSVGLFQQRQAGWGTIQERMNPYGSAGLFFNAMVRKYPNWRAMDPGAVAQGVQVSAFPDRYGQRMPEARAWVDRLFDQGGLAHGRGIMMKDVIRPERVLDADLTRSFDEKLIPILERLTTMSPQDVLSPADRRAVIEVDLPGAQIIGQQVAEQHIHTESNLERATRQATKRAMAEARI